MYKSFTNLNSKDNVFLPTYSYRMLKNLNKTLPNADFIMSDFDLLRNSPSNRIGFNAPTVSTKLEASDAKVDYSSYLVPRGKADIFFPTDFRFLKALYQNVTGKKSLIMKSYEFVDEYSERNWVRTKSGYNPLKEDFSNTSFFLSKNV